MMRRRTVMLLLAAVTVVPGCLERTPYVTADSSDKVAKYLLDRPPEQIQHKTDANLEGKLVLLGYDVAQDTVEAGSKLEVTWYWQCLSAPGPGWRLFTHAHDEKGRSLLNVDANGPIRQYFQPEYWRPGLVIRDVQKITVPRDWKSTYLELRTGLWKEDERMKVTGKSADDSNRVVGPRVKVVKPTPVSIDVPRAASAPVLDGQFEQEEVWKSAARLSPFKQTLSGQEVDRTTEVRLLWDDKNLYVAMRASDDYLVSRYTKQDDELWNEDAFEMFLDPGGDQKDYYELQVSPAGVVFDSHLPRYRQNQNDWTSHMEVKVALEGKLNVEAGEDKGWTAEAAIPFSSMAEGGGVPPKAGDRWRANFFRIDLTKDKPVYSGWSPPMRGDFHALDKFGQLVFSGPPEEKAEKKAEPKENTGKEAE